MSLRKWSLFLVLWSPFIVANDWGNPPEGFRWHENSEAKIAIPVPSEWYIKEEKKGGTVGVYASKENIDAKGRFETGYTLNYLKNISKTTGVESTKYALAFILEVQNSKEVLLEPWAKELGAGLTGMGIRYLDTERNPSVVIHYYLVADSEEDTLRMMIFESLEKNWDSAWEIGEVMLSRGQLWK